MNNLSDILTDKAQQFFNSNNYQQKNNNNNSGNNNPESNIYSGNNHSLTPNIKTPQQFSSPISYPTQESGFDINKIKLEMIFIKDRLESLIRILQGEKIKLDSQQEPNFEIQNTGERIIEGVFNGERMVGSDGKEYTIPPNYASKSKLVEGDIMKLTITNNGSFIYKQIGPIKRKRIVGELVFASDTGQWSVLVNGRTYKILTASVTFYKGKSGDEAIILVPEDEESGWGAVENIIKKH